MSDRATLVLTVRRSDADRIIELLAITPPVHEIDGGDDWVTWEEPEPPEGAWSGIEHIAWRRIPFVGRRMRTMDSEEYVFASRGNGQSIYCLAVGGMPVNQISPDGTLDDVSAQHAINTAAAIRDATSIIKGPTAKDPRR